MKKSTNNKKIFFIILVLIVVILYFIFSLGRRDFIYYKVIKNYDELKKEVNMDAVELIDYPIKDSIKEKEYIEKLSESFIEGFGYYSSPFTEEEIIIRNMEDLDLLRLIYIFMTKGNDSICIKGSFIKEMMYKYFRITDYKISDETKEYLFDRLKNSYCFKYTKFDNVELKLVSYQNNKNNIVLKYEEYNNEEKEIYDWDIVYKIDNEGYYLYSFNNIIRGE